MFALLMEPSAMIQVSISLQPDRTMVVNLVPGKFRRNPWWPLAEPRLKNTALRGVTRREKGATIPREPNHCGGAEKSQQHHKYFIQRTTSTLFSAFACFFGLFRRNPWWPLTEPWLKKTTIESAIALSTTTIKFFTAIFKITRTYYLLVHGCDVNNSVVIKW